VMQQVGQLEKV